MYAATMGKYLLINDSGHDGNSNVYYLEWIYKGIHFVYKNEISSDVDLAFLSETRSKNTVDVVVRLKYGRPI